VHQVLNPTLSELIVFNVQQDHIPQAMALSVNLVLTVQFQLLQALTPVQNVLAVTKPILPKRSALVVQEDIIQMEMEIVNFVPLEVLH